MGAHTSSSPPGRRGSRAREVRAALDAVRRIVQGVRVFAAQAERRTGLSGAQLFVLQQLGEAPAQSLNELAARTRTHQSSVSTVVTRLVARGLVTRRRAPEDGRRLLLELSPAGRAVLAEAPETAQTRLIAALERLPARELVALSRGLERLVRALGMEGGAAPLLLESEPERPGRGPARR